MRGRQRHAGSASVTGPLAWGHVANKSGPWLQCLECWQRIKVASSSLERELFNLSRSR